MSDRESSRGTGTVDSGEVDPGPPPIGPLDDLETTDRADGEARAGRSRTLTLETLEGASGAEATGARPAVDRRMGGYLLVRELGRGGMGVVYEAVQLGLNRPVAIKRIRRGALAADRDLQRFRGEAEVIATLDHPNIVPIHEIGQHEGEYYFCMKLFEGRDLRSRLSDFHGRPRAIARLVGTIAGAVQYAHQRGILHRDLKPSNILLDSEDRPHLVDFGLAQRVDRVDDPDAGGVMGTPGFMAPEQASGSGRASTLSDVYGLGAVLYALLTGVPPFEAGTTPALLKAVIEGEPVPPSGRSQGVDPDLEAVCLKALAKDPGLRYASAREMAEDLGRWLDGEPILARPYSRAERAVLWARRRPTVAGLWAGLAASAALGLAGIVAALLLAVHRERQAVAREEEARRQAYLATIRIGERDYRDANIGRLLDDLGAAEPPEGREDLRGFEWYYLRSLCRQDRLTLKASDRPLRGVALHPDGSRLVVVGDDVRGQVRDGPTGRLIHSATAGDPRGQGVAFHPNGREFVTATSAGEVRLWDLATSQEIRAFEGFAGRAFRVVVSPDGGRVAAGGERGRLLVWEVASGRLLHDLKGHPDGADIAGLACSRDGRWLASSAGDGPVRIWDLEAGRLVRTLEGLGGPSRGLDFADDGSRLAVTAGDRVVILSTVDWARVREFRAEFTHNLVMGLDFNEAGTLLATGGFDQVVRVWDAATGGLVRSFKGHAGALTDVKFDPRLPRLASADGLGVLKFWGVDDEQDARRLPGQGGTVTDIHYGPAGSWLASSGEDGSVLLREAPTGKAIRTLTGHRGVVREFSISPDGSRLASVGHDKTLRISEVATGRLLHEVAEGDRLQCVAYSPDGRWLAYAGDGRVVRLWDVARGRVVRTLGGHLAGVLGLGFSPDGSRLAAAGKDPRVLIWDTASGRLAGPECAGDRDGEMINALAYSPDGLRLAAAGRGRRVRLWDARSGELLRTFAGHMEAVRDLAFSPDGRRLASSGTDALRLWDVELGRELMAFEPLEARGQAVAFSPDGRWLASGDGDRAIRLRGPGTAP